MKGIVLVVGMSAVFTTAGALFDNSNCDINVWSAEQAQRHNVPGTCHGGTFRWNYPEGSSYLYFPKQQQSKMKVCIKNLIGGKVFTVRDVTHGIGMPFVIGKLESCTLPANVSITLRIDAPGRFTYFGILEYAVKY